MQYTCPVTPKELGFDGGDYPQWRQFQASTIEKIMNSPKKLVIVSAPTGSGKSPIALACARLAMQDGKRTTIVTSSKALQSQYLDYSFPTDEFDEGQPVTATGRSNHPCIRPDADPGTTAAGGICVEGKQCEFMGSREDGIPATCPWYASRDKAEASPIRVLNYPFFILMASYQGFFRRNALLICDEGHKVDKEILRAAVAELDQYDLRLLVDWGGYKPRVFEPLLSRNPQVVAWATEMTDLIDRRFRETGGRMSAHGRRVKDTLDRIGRLKDKMVVIDQRDGGLKFSPVLPEEFAREFLLNHADKVVLMSATIFGKEYWASRFGLSVEEVDFIEIPSTFPAENRKVYYMPVLQMNAKVWANQDEIETKLVGAIDDLIARNLPHNGLIHTANKKLAEFIKDRSKFAKLMLVGGGSRAAEFVNMPGPKVFVSYSATEGLDFADDICRYTIVAKVPWPPKEDPVIKVQMEEIPGFYQYEAISGIVQGVGRGVRHKDDWAINYILDKSYMYLHKQTEAELPTWYLQAWQKVS